MYPVSFEIVRADTLSEAAMLLREAESQAEILAGGQSLVPLLKMRMAVPDTLVDISHIEPEPISITNDTASIPALTTHRSVGDHDGLTETFDLIQDCIPEIGDPQIRNMGTVGGSLAEADPGGDWGPLVLATDGTIHTTGPDGGRDIPAKEFFDGPFMTKLAPDELIESVSLPVPTGEVGSAYLKVKSRQGGYGIASVGVQLSLGEDGRCQTIGIGCSDDVNAYVDLSRVEAALADRLIDEESLEEAADLVYNIVSPAADERGSAEFKRNLCRVLFIRAVTVAHNRANQLDEPADPVRPVELA